MAPEVGIIKSKFPQGREMTLDPIQPRNIGGCPVELDPVLGSINSTNKLDMHPESLEDKFSS